MEKGGGEVKKEGGWEVHDISGRVVDYSDGKWQMIGFGTSVWGKWWWAVGSDGGSG